MFQCPRLPGMYVKKSELFRLQKAPTFPFKSAGDTQGQIHYGYDQKDPQLPQVLFGRSQSLHPIL